MTARAPRLYIVAFSGHEADQYIHGLPETYQNFRMVFFVSGRPERARGVRFQEGDELHYVAGWGRGPDQESVRRMEEYLAIASIGWVPVIKQGNSVRAGHEPVPPLNDRAALEAWLTA